MELKLATTLALGVCLLSAPAMAQQPGGPTPSAEKKMTNLPAGPLFWRIENFPTVGQAQAAAGSTGLVAEAAGKVWLFTLGPSGKSSADGTKVAEIGPIPPVAAPEYLLQIREAKNAPGNVTPVHTHPGSEASYVLAGEVSQKTPNGVTRTGAGQSSVGHGPDTPMQVSTGSTESHVLVMFVVDATKPFSSPAKFE